MKLVRLFNYLLRKYKFMNKEAVKAKSQDKVKSVETLCKQLQLVVTAEQILTQQGFIKHIVYYTDTEQYEMDEEPKKPITEKKDEEVNKDDPTKATKTIEVKA